MNECVEEIVTGMCGMGYSTSAYPGGRANQCPQDPDEALGMGMMVQPVVGCTIVLDQCKEIEENNRMGKTRDLFKKIRDTEHFMQRWAQ